MANAQLDPNRFASDLEAPLVLARVEIEQADLDLASRRHEVAAAALKDAEARFQDAQTVYLLHKAARDDAAAYEDGARQQLDASRARLAAVRASLHPVRKTPPEVLVLIFEYCLEHLVQTWYLPTHDAQVRARQLQPFRLAAVGRLWRHVVLGNPRLWTTVELKLDSVRHRRVPVWCDYLRTVLSRSGSAGLHIRITRARQPKDTDQPLISCVLDNLHRCLSLYIYLTTIAADNDNALPLLVADTLSLHTLHLRVQHMSIMVGAFDSSPKRPVLRQVQATFPFDMMEGLEYDSISTATLRDCCLNEDGNDLHHFLDMAPNVSELYLLRPDLSEWAFNTTSASVTTLHVAYDDDDELLPPLGDYFVLPNLKKLHLRGTVLASSARMKYLARVSENSPALTHVVVNALDEVGVSELVSALKSCTQLRRLEIWGAHFTPSAFRELCGALGSTGDDGTWVCPALRVLTLARTCTFDAACDHGLLARSVQARMSAATTSDAERAPSHLITVNVRACIEPAVAARLQELLSHTKVRRWPPCQI